MDEKKTNGSTTFFSFLGGPALAAARAVAM
jgi:hypothetical protein